VSSDIPTPKPRPAADGIDEVSARAFAEIFQALVNVGADRQDAERYAFAAQLALDLPARDARIRADERRKIDKEIRRYAAQLRDTGAGTSAIVAEDVAGRVAAADDSPVAGSAVPAEGSGHPQPVEHRRADTRCDACWRGSCPGHPHPVTEPARTERDDRG